MHDNTVVFLSAAAKLRGNENSESLEEEMYYDIEETEDDTIKISKDEDGKWQILDENNIELKQK